MKRRLLAVTTIAILLVALALVALSHRGPDQNKLVAGLDSAKPVAATDLGARFLVLSKQHTNQCGLRASSLETLARGGRLQGACCSAMGYEHYRRQMHGLKRYNAVEELPKDPYDVPVSLAKRLIGYRTAITLSGSEQTVYDRAIKLAKEHGPCCCHCWRWDAFEGQAKFLISRRAYTSPQVAEVWDLEDGCGSDQA
jgi:hypothetical protein